MAFNVSVHNSCKIVTVRAKAYTGADGVKNTFNLELDGEFKMVLIKYTGDISGIAQSYYNGMLIKHGLSQVFVINNLRQPLTNHLLCEFEGHITKITSVKVFRWGEGSIIASMVQPNKTILIEESEEVFNTTGVSFPSNSEPISQKRSETDLIEVEKEKTKLSGRIKADYIIGFYTHGGKLSFKNKQYVGNYHYNIVTQQYMSGAEPTLKSQPLTKILKRRKFYGL